MRKLVPGAGKKLYRHVNLDELSSQAETEGGFWIWVAEKLSTHPHLPKRVRVLRVGAQHDTEVRIRAGYTQVRTADV